MHVPMHRSEAGIGLEDIIRRKSTNTPLLDISSPRLLLPGVSMSDIGLDTSKKRLFSAQKKCLICKGKKTISLKSIGRGFVIRAECKKCGYSIDFFVFSVLLMFSGIVTSTASLVLLFSMNFWIGYATFFILLIATPAVLFHLCIHSDRMDRRYNKSILKEVLMWEIK